MTLDAGAIAAVIAEARARRRSALDEPAAKRVLAACGIAVPKRAQIGSTEAIVPALAGLAPPFALKLVAPGILHKSEVGGVALHLADVAAVEVARRQILAAPALAGVPIDGFLVEEMAPAGHEMLVGGKRDPQFGPLVVLGLGGVFTELLDDVALRLAPLRPGDAADMLDGLKGVAALRGARGGRAANEAAIRDVLWRLAGPTGLLTLFADDIAELDINPLIVSPAGAVAADARIVLAPAAPRSSLAPSGQPAAPPRDAKAVCDRFAPLFAPRTVAVLGASSGGQAPANAFIRHLRAFGFPGPIYPIHPSAEAIEGLEAYPSLAATPEPVDYAFVAIAAPQVAAALTAGAGRVRFAQVMSSGFGEAEGGGAREAELVAAARAAGMRLLGPNCLGTYSPRGRLTFIGGMSDRPGAVGVLSQSGGLSMDTMRRGQRRGLAFSGVVTIGNCADLGAADLLEFLIADAATRVIGLYLEHAGDGRRLFELMSEAALTKPVVLLKGGRTRQGQRAALSHTGALASDDRVWQALARQTGAALVETLDDFIDALLTFQLLEPRPERPTGRVALFGNGGGTSVLAADIFAREGFIVAAPGEATTAALRALDLPAGSSIANPIDVPASILRRESGKAAGAILDALFACGEADAVVMHINMPVVLSYRGVDMLGNLMAAALDAASRYPGRAHLALVLRSDGEPEVEAQKQAYRERAVAAGIPVYDEVPAAARALVALRTVEAYRRRRQGV